MHHKEASLLVSRVIIGTAGEISSKTHALRCFHKHHEMCTTRELNPGGTCLDTFISAARHHSWKLSSPGSGVHYWSPTPESIWSQTFLENTHPTRMCWIFSSSCSHNKQCGEWSNPQRARQSIVQQQLREANHKKNLHLDGGYIPHILFVGLNWIAPKNNLL
jgi:hypothetical protein